MNNVRNLSIQSCFSLGAACLLPVLFCCALTAVAQAPVPDSPAIESQAQALVAKLTLEEKIALLGGEDGMFTRAIASIGLPRFKMSDGPVGVRTWGPTTAYPGGAALAASWDTALARRIGEGLGRDARALPSGWQSSSPRAQRHPACRRRRLRLRSPNRCSAQSPHSTR
jgi:beta-glucosidase